MAILEELRADQDPRLGRCKVGAWIAERPDNERREWLEALRDRTITAMSIYRAMTKRGAVLGKTTVADCRGANHDHS